MTDHKQRQITKAESEGRKFLADRVSHEAFKAGSAQGRWPAGSVWLWAAQVVYGPARQKEEAA